MHGRVVENDIERGKTKEAASFLSSFVFRYACFLNPFLIAIPKPYNNNRAVAATNIHLIKVNFADNQATRVGVDGYTDNMVTMPRFSKRSNNHAPNGTTLYLCMLLLDAKPRWKSHVIARLKNNV